MATPTAAKLPPVDECLFEHVESLRPPHVSQHDHPHAYASEALGCDRKIGLRLLDVPKSNPVDGSSKVTFWMGDTIHDLVQQAILKRYPEAKAEVSWSLGKVTGRADMTYQSLRDGKLVICEIKSVAPYSFDLATGKKKGEEGPRSEHVMQANLSALALGAHFLHIVYVNKSASGKQNPVAEWRRNADPDAASVELKRLERLVDLAERKEIPARMWGGSLIDDPTTIAFPCSYCEWQDACAGIPNPEPETEVPF